MKISAFLKSLLAVSIIITLSALSGCNVRVADNPNANGVPYEIIVSIKQAEWDGELGDTLRAVLKAPVPMINQYEPQYNLLRVNPQAVDGLILRHRNILNVFVSSDNYKEAGSRVDYDKYSKPQVVVTLFGPDEASIIKYLSDNKEAVQRIFEIVERDRTVALVKRAKEPVVQNAVLTAFDMNLGIPRGYKVRNKIGDDFLWISNEHPNASQGIVIYTYPYSGKEDLRAKNIVARRNEFVSRIPGPSDGSYMTTSDYGDMDYSQLQINGRQWVKMRGFWDVENDFMGGPFINYSTLNPNTGEIIAIDFYVYSPDKPKRNMLRSLDHLVYTVSFPADRKE